MLMHQEKLKFNVEIINLMLTKIFVKPLLNAQHLNGKQVEQSNKKILQSTRNNRIWLLNVIEKQNFITYFNNLETSKNSKPFWDKCRPYFSKKHAHGDSKIILIEKEEITTNTNEIVEIETLFVNNDEIAKTFINILQNR